MGHEALEARLLSLEQEIASIKERNLRVESDKAWETSLTRRVTLVIFTYLFTAIVFCLIGVESFWLSAIIPALAFYLSTLTLPAIKAIWRRGQSGREG